MGDLIRSKAFTFPVDLRSVKCKICVNGLFLSQDISEAMNHVLTEHPDCKDVNTALQYGCQGCTELKFAAEGFMAKHIEKEHGKERDVTQELGRAGGQKLDEFLITRKWKPIGDQSERSDKQNKMDKSPSEVPSSQKSLRATVTSGRN